LTEATFTFGFQKSKQFYSKKIIFFNFQSKMLDNLLLNCTNPQVRAARFDHSITDYFIPLHNDEQNFANLLLAPEAWPTIYRFFSSLEISL
jgi:hypothetical protein